MEKERKQKLIKQIIEEYKITPIEQRSLTKLSKKFGIQRQTLARHLKAEGIEVTNYQSSIKVDQYIFDVIDTEEKAYWLGFLFADGNISSSEDKLEINLSATDVDHLEKFRTFLKAANKVRIRKNYGKGNEQCRFMVRNKRIWQALYDKGCVPNKSLILKFPDKNIFSDESLIRHFIRGYCDGDGSLGLYRVKDTDKKTSNLSFVGTPDFLNGIKQFLKIKGFIRNKSCKNHKNKAYDLKYFGVGARKVARILYEGATIYLDRKYKIFESFGLYEEESPRRKSSKIGEPCDGNTEVSSEIAKGSETPQSVEGE